MTASPYQSVPIRQRRLGPRDERVLRAFWQRAPHAHLFAIPDLDYLGWEDPRLLFTGWFMGEELLGYLMLYGVSAQWSYHDERLAPHIAAALDSATHPVEFITGMEATGWPVIHALRTRRVRRYELSTVAKLHAADFNEQTLHHPHAQARQATLHELDAVTAVHVAAPDQWNQLGYTARRRALRSAMTDGWRRVYFAANHEGSVVASAQTTAEGDRMAVIGAVVTHPAHRGHGYATLVTAALCQALLAEQRTPYLFYRRDNEPAARVYQKIGFVPLGDALLVELEATD